jgi:hypothetical protein
MILGASASLLKRGQAPFVRIRLPLIQERVHATSGFGEDVTAVKPADSLTAGSFMAQTRRFIVTIPTLFKVKRARLTTLPPRRVRPHHRMKDREQRRQAGLPKRSLDGLRRSFASILRLGVVLVKRRQPCRSQTRMDDHSITEAHVLPRLDRHAAVL